MMDRAVGSPTTEQAQPTDQAKGKRHSAVQRSFWMPAFGMAGLLMGLILFVHRNSPRTLVSFHGFIHAALAQEFLQAGPWQFPPENPFFAGRPVVYYWLFQFLGARLADLFGWNVFYGMEALIVLASGLLILACAALGRRLFRSTSAGIGIGFLVVAGTNPFGWVIGLYKGLKFGQAALIDDPNHLWGVVHPIFSLARYNDIGGLYGPLINFFLNITSRPVALALLAVSMLGLWFFLPKRGLGWALLLVILVALTTAFNPIVGLAVGGALPAAMGIVWAWGQFWSRRSRSGGPSAPQIRLAIGLPTVVAMGVIEVAGILAALPTYSQLFSGLGGGHFYIGLFSMEGLRHLITLGLDITPLAALALYGALRADRPVRPYLAVLLVTAFILVGGDAVLRIPPGNEANLYHAAVVLLAIPAGGALLAPRRNATEPHTSLKRWVGVLLLFLPTTLVVVAAYLNRPPIPIAFQGETLARQADGTGLSDLYQWVKEQTNPEAVFVLDPRQRTAMVGNTAEFPALTRRAIFTEHFLHYMVYSYPDSTQRYQIAVDLVSGQNLDNGQQQVLAALGRPIYIVIENARDNQAMTALEQAYGAPVFAQGEAAVFQWK